MVGSIVVAVGFFAPAALLVAFVPMFFIAAAFYWMNRADQDCGTTFSWVTRAMGPNTGWIAGWAVCMTGILVIGSLADVAVLSFFDLIEVEPSKIVIVIGAVLLIAAMTTVCVIGTEASARLQMVLMALQILPLLLFIVVILVKVFGGDGPGSSFEPNLSWFNPLNIEAGNLNPFSAESGGLVGAMLLGIFIYWGWESAVNLNEETEGDVSRPGLAGLISTVILLITYVGVATAVLAWNGIGGAAAFDDKPGILAKYAEAHSATSWASSCCSRWSSRRSPRPRPRSCRPREPRCRWPGPRRSRTPSARSRSGSSPRSSRRSRSASSRPPGTCPAS